MTGRRIGILIGIAAAFAGAQSVPTGVRQGDIIAHLARTISWYRNVETAADLSGGSADVLMREGAHQFALKGLQLAFDFARAEAALLARGTQQPGADGAAPNLNQAAQRSADRVNGIQTRINDLNATIAKAPAREAPVLQARRRELESELTLAREVQRTVEGMVSFNGGVGLSGTLSSQIDALERSVPEALHGQRTSSATAPAAHAAVNPDTFKAESSGVFTLISQAFSLARAGNEIQAAIRATDKLAQQTDRLRSPLLTAIRAAVKRSEDLTNDSASEAVKELAADQREIDRLTAEFKQLSTALVPLGEQQVVIGQTRANLAEMLNGLKRQRSDATRYLLLRSAGLTVVVLVLLLLSTVWRRATFRYVRDPRRRRQFMVIRRTVIGLALTMAIVLGFISDFGSLATYAGFLTAGIAVALQNVLLAVVAYFFLIGRYGVRIGDRVTVSGVTGNVIDIGLVRIYLMELAKQGGDWYPTGRVVVFSNAVLFSPSALYKQLPGADFAWHTVTLILTPESPIDLAKEKLSAVVLSVYQEYRTEIEKQHAALEESVDMRMSRPAPDSRLQYTDKGLEFSVRYPVETERASATDEKILKALHDAVQAEPRLRFTAGGNPQAGAD